MSKPARKVDADTRDLADRLWRGALRWADRTVKPRFVALVCEFLAHEPGCELDSDELSVDEKARVEASLARLERRQAAKRAR